ncbi:LuxR family transcriptional regulator [Dactylosporangium fulvum]
MIPRMGGLPEAVTTFVGRRQKLADVREALGGSRLVTLTGPGGVGKTRLALRVASEVRKAFPDGVWFVDLSDHADPALVASVAAGAIGLVDESTHSPLVLLSSHFAQRRALLVLDNCEHVLDASATLADHLLRAAPRLHILVTSRQVLGIPAEKSLQVPPLSVPGPEAVQPGDLVLSDAVALFIDRARGVLSEFVLDQRNAQAVATLCRRLDGLPLAIEMAATRLRGLSPEQIVERLDERYSLLIAGSRVSRPRQSSLQSLFDWSYELCSPSERRLWARASVFSGGFDLEAAEEVCSGEDLPREAVLENVIALVEKSVLVREERDGRVRFRMIETLLEYGRRRLAESSELPLLQARHRVYISGFVERACQAWYSSAEPEWRERIRANLPNIRSALDYCISDPEHANAGLRIAQSLWYGWRVNGMVGEGRRWLQRMLEVAPTKDRGRTLAVLADAALALFQGDDAGAVRRLAEAVALAHKQQDDQALAYVKLFEGHLAMTRGDMGIAAETLQAALAAQRQVNDPLGTALTLIRLALVLSEIGQPDAARETLDSYRALNRDRGSDLAEAMTDWARSVLAWQAGDVAAASRFARLAVDRSWSMRELVCLGRAIEVLVWTSAVGGEPERAARLLGSVEAIRSVLGHRTFGYDHLTRYDQESAEAARAALGDERFTACFAAGSTRPTEDNIAFALGHPLPRVVVSSGAQAVGAGLLSKRETEVAELVAKGMSNKEIAGQLVISQRTAETHVEHILTKLGLASRIQIAAWIRERGSSS